MTEKTDPDVQALQRLCNSNGGYVGVAKVLGVNDQTIYQVVSGVVLPSGNPKGIGPKIRKLLNEHFPGWNRIQPKSEEMPERLKAAVATITALLRTLPEDQLGNAVMDIAEVLRRDRRL